MTWYKGVMIAVMIDVLLFQTMKQEQFQLLPLTLNMTHVTFHQDTSEHNADAMFALKILNEQVRNGVPHALQWALRRSAAIAAGNPYNKLRVLLSAPDQNPEVLVQAEAHCRQVKRQHIGRCSGLQ